MKKKLKAKDLRNQEKAAQKAKFQELNNLLPKPANKPAAEAKDPSAGRKTELNTLNPVRERKLSTEKKSTAKAAGLKSTFVLNETDLLMTAFGKGNQAIPEKRIRGRDVTTIPEKPAFDASPEQDLFFRIDGRITGGMTDNPLHAAEDRDPRKGMDLIRAKSALEKRYFGRVFTDNIHIQAIYNILDIEKTLTVHINNIVYTLNNFMRQEGEDLDDLVGYITLYNSLQKLQASEKDSASEIRQLFDRLCSAKQLGYLNLEVLPEKKPEDGNDKKGSKKDPNTVKLTREEFFDTLYILGYLRQMLTHGSEKQNIYKIDSFKDNKTVTSLLNKLYADRVNDLNRSFLKTAEKNLVMLFRAYEVNSPERKKEYVRAYYDFVVRKQYKNTGFSIKLIREHMASDIEEAFVLRDQRYDTVRGKLYPFVDFALFRFYQEHSQEAEELVSRLRASGSEVEKDGIYGGEAKRIWPLVRGLILDHILPEMSGDVIKQITGDPQVKEDMITDIRIGSDATVFSKIIYLVTLFIDGKEINDLLTTLIHTFESIAAFMEVMKTEGLPTDYVEEYRLFSMSQKVADELRIINSFARMTKPSAHAKEIMFIEAFKVLGIQADESGLKRMAEEILSPDAKVKDPQKRGLRNFIANNVIESDRFKYLVRFGNVNKLKGIANNRQVIRFVLEDIPDTQIQRYYNSVTGSDTRYYPGMRDRLADRLTSFSFDDIKDVQQNTMYAFDYLKENLQEEKRRKQALVRLYLTVLYLAVKNLVYINSRYALAFHCLERDRLLLDKDKWSHIKKEDPAFDTRAFSRDHLAKYPPSKKRVAAYLETNFNNSDDYMIRAFRNKVAHLDAVRNADLYLADLKHFSSWFEIYHYIIQRRLIDQYHFDKNKPSTKVEGTMVISEAELNPKTLEYFGMVEKHHTVCKDFIKALCVPFAYNLPRYKNLSIDALFDRNRPGKKGDGRPENEGGND